MKNDFDTDALLSNGFDDSEPLDDEDTKDDDDTTSNDNEETEDEETDSDDESDDDDDDDKKADKRFSELSDKLLNRISQLENKLNTKEKEGKDSVSVNDIKSNFIDENVDLTSHEDMNKAMKAVYVAAVNDILKTLPKIVDESVGRKASQRAAADTFYKQNPELKQHASYVKVLAQELANNNPNWTPDRLLSETAKVAKARLNIKKKADNREKKRSGSNFAKSGGKPGGANINTGKSDNKIQSQIEELLNLR